MKRIRLEIEGIVQGVGFRPFVYRLADMHSLTGWVRNTPAGVLLEAEGDENALNLFLLGIEREAPPLAVINDIKREDIPPYGGEGFVILASGGGEAGAQISPDSDVCPDCLRELFDPADRRYRYPFINCTNCGPRYSIITGIPYDRPLTTMAVFTMCPDCLSEYENPANRRFHAQPNACPACGPRLRLVDAKGGAVAGDPLDMAISLLKKGNILAVKGTGGYHLAVDACNEAAVSTLRRRKKRDEKPFALMSPTLGEISRYALCSQTEGRLLAGTERPIVLLKKRDRGPGTGDWREVIATSVAPVNGYFGAMLPSTPLHHLLLKDNFIALVMTSGNLSDEPISYRDDEALERLAEIADFYLSHDREIQTRTDDSVIRVFLGNPLFLRRSRGYVPRGILLPFRQQNVLAVGAELKSTICLTRGDKGFMSQHIGDLQNAATLRSLEETVTHLSRVLEIKPEVVAHDLHPDYLSTGYAADIPDLPKVAVQHHHAHMASCMAENGLEGDAIGVVFDGTGYGLDGETWGGEFLLGDYRGFQRMGHFHYVPMPGGDAAVREPFRMALSYCYETYGEEAFTHPLPFLASIDEHERKLYCRMLERRINSPLTSSCGRLFDAVAAIMGLRNSISYEGQAAIELEALAEKGRLTWNYPYAIVKRDNMLVADFRLMIAALVQDLLAGDAGADAALRFHDTLAAVTADICGKIRRESGVERVVLSGGVFQNKLLSERIYALLQERNFQVYTHRLVPPNDGGLALGQAVIAGHSNASFPQSQR
ncbi:MAG: hydrogenase maturation protein [Geobacteraceae bacterium]|nr:MAG: hydrogenase maturation protein [Geobacteraceae bacterium]